MCLRKMLCTLLCRCARLGRTHEVDEGVQEAQKVPAPSSMPATTPVRTRAHVCECSNICQYMLPVLQMRTSLRSTQRSAHKFPGVSASSVFCFDFNQLPRPRMRALVHMYVNMLYICNITCRFDSIKPPFPVRHGQRTSTVTLSTVESCGANLPLDIRSCRPQRSENGQSNRVNFPLLFPGVACKVCSQTHRTTFGRPQSLVCRD